MKKTLRFKIICFVLPVIIVCFVCINIFCSQMFFQILQKNIIRSEEQRLEQYAQHITYMQMTTESLGKIIAVDDRFQKLYQMKEQTDTFQREKQKKEVKELLKQYLLLRTDCYQITLVFSDGTYYSNTVQEIPNYNQSTWYRKYKESKKQQSFVERHDISIVDSRFTVNSLTYVLSTRCINNPAAEAIDIVIEMNPDVFFGKMQLDSHCTTGFVLMNENSEVLDESGSMTEDAHVILSGKSIPKQTKCQNGNILLTSKSMGSDWKGVIEISRDRLVEEIQRYTQYITGIMVVSCIFLLAILLKVLMWITRPVYQLMEASACVGCGNLEYKVEIHSKDEFEELGKTFNSMTHNLQNYIKQSVEDEKVKKDMEIDKLVLQINPHFIYNTLNTIAYMAEEADNSLILEFVNSFSALLQDSLNTGRDTYFTALSQEIKNLRNYIILQKYRYEDKIELNCLVPSELLGCRVPNILLQPLVENAIFHGLLSKKERGEISVSARRNGCDLYIQVQDNGVGMTSGKIQEIMNDVDLSAGDMRKIGAGNVKNRISYIYGNEYGMEIQSELGVGTTVTLHIPYELEEKDRV
ncbi:MAG: histidine kinase [Lachnospiraceae bacterium]|nr:histidine kinase [Lachnospiraceae bacterium]